MRVLLCPDKYKGSLAAHRVTQAMEMGIHRVDAAMVVDHAPMADGGDGTVDAFLAAQGGERVPVEVTSPLGQPVPSFYGRLPDGTAIIEMAAASGLTMVPVAQRNPLHTTSRGTGELIHHALTHGAKKLILGIGGSATNEGGMGMLYALGARFYDRLEQEIPLDTGTGMLHVAHIRLEGLLPQIQEAEILVASDVSNPLAGKDGASAIFGPQKGASADMISLLDEGLVRFGTLLGNAAGRPYLDLSGAGAAGGMGGALHALGGKLLPGTEIVMETTHLRSRMKDCDLVLTGEGATDASTLFGKVPHAVGKLAKELEKPCYCISGCLLPGYEPILQDGVTAAFSILNRPMTEEEAFLEAPQLISNFTEQLLRMLVHPYMR